MKRVRMWEQYREIPRPDGAHRKIYRGPGSMLRGICERRRKMASEWCTEQAGPARLQQVPPVIAAECNGSVGGVMFLDRKS
ncbi:hypothetical protein [Murimonas intestini]|uniref:hypothetical protein n=1 Tax=Murimonas intestini TaxID=1337051 RepID=UPI0011DCE469|nr:hypothetical protein [Murimonas intestini]